MMAVIAAIVFVLALLFDWADISSDAFSTSTLMVLGLLFLALHLAGVGSGWTWRNRVGSYRRRR
jgi:hypothetical protein